MLVAALFNRLQQRPSKNLATEKPAAANRLELAAFLVSATPLERVLQVFTPRYVIALNAVFDPENIKSRVTAV